MASLDQTTEPKSDQMDALSDYFSGRAPPVTTEPSERVINPNIEYDFSHSERGKAIIINNKNFDKATGQDARDGTDVDATNIMQTLLRLDFNVEIYNDLTRENMLDLMFKCAIFDHSEADSFVCVILSHGLEGRVFGTNGTIPVDNLFAPFKGDRSPTLAGKPKMFFIQACRGRKYDEGIEVTDGPESLEDKDEPDSGHPRRIPVEADFLMMYSVVPGHYSWRNNVDGSWFIQALCQVLREYGRDLELLHLLTLVNSVVAADFASDTGYIYSSGMKQVPSIVSRLTRLVYFKPKIAPQ